MVPILAMEDQPNNRVRVTIGAPDFSQWTIIVEKSAMNDPGYIQMLDLMWQRQCAPVAKYRRTQPVTQETE
jgi:hypothetical protein